MMKRIDNDTMRACGRLLSSWEEPEPAALDLQPRARKRQIPHAEGNFATFVYVPVPRKVVDDSVQTAVDSLRQLCELTNDLQVPEETGGLLSFSSANTDEASPPGVPLENAVNSTAGTDVNADNSGGAACPVCSRSGERQAGRLESTSPASSWLTSSTEEADENLETHRKRKQRTADQVSDSSNLHLSLCRTFMLQYHLIEPFLAKLSAKLKQRKGFTLELQNQVDIFSNDDHSCFFAAVSVSPICASRLVAPLVADINEVVTSFGGTALSVRPFQPHVSVAWTAEDIRPALLSVSRETSECTNTPAESSSSSPHSSADTAVESPPRWWPAVGQALKKLRAQPGSDAAAEERAVHTDAAQLHAEQSEANAQVGGRPKELENAQDSTAETETDAPPQADSKFSKSSANTAPSADADTAHQACSAVRRWLKVQKVCITVGKQVTAVPLHGAESDSDCSSYSDAEGA